MKSQTAPKKVAVKALRGFAGEEGKDIKKGASVELSKSLARIVVLAGRAEYVTETESAK